MTKKHSIIPPPELVEDWIELAKPLPKRPPNPGELATLAARWGADQELEACCAWVSQWCGRWPDGARPEDELRAARRPKLSSLKEQALAALNVIEDRMLGPTTEEKLIRKALEALPND